MEKNEIKTDLKIDLKCQRFLEINEKFELFMADYKFNEALQIIWEKIRLCDVILSETTPWKLSDQNEIAKILIPLAQDILNISYLLEPFIPNSAKIIQAQFSAVNIKKGEILFPRL